MKYSGDARAKALFDEGYASLAKTLPLSRAWTPAGLASSYDLLRGGQKAPLRLRTKKRLKVRAAAIVSEVGTQLSRLNLPVVRTTRKPSPPVSSNHKARTVPNERRTNLLRNPNFARWKRDVPTRWWIKGTPAAISNAGQLARIRTDGSQSNVLVQDVPASRLSAGRTYRLSVEARLPVAAVRSSTSGRINLAATCADGVKVLAQHYAIRGDKFSRFDITATPPAGCGLRVMLYQNQYTFRGTVIEYRQAELTEAEPVGRAVVPTYPLQLLYVARPAISVKYRGKGALQAWAQGRWWTVAKLSKSRRSALVAVPDWAQGRNIHLDYHQTHVHELTSLNQMSGNPLVARTAREWFTLAPLYWDLGTMSNRRSQTSPRTLPPSRLPVDIGPNAVGGQQS